MSNLKTLQNMRLCVLFKACKTGEYLTAIYHFRVQIISRGSGRSAVGAAAYRAGEKLKAIGAAAYRSGGELGRDGDVIVHDYSRKGGVAYSEIILPQNAPPEFADRETLWNAVEASEIRKDAQLAREIEAALQKEFALQEQIQLLREYIKENFVDKGMCADFSIHDKRDGNPHAHIMLTTRNVTSDGFGKKNRDWNEAAQLVKWRENWADINNRKFEEKGLEERIDHRTLKAQGIDREPTIHMGHEASALEKMGIRTQRGDINRAIQRRNAERAAPNEASQIKIESAEQDTQELRKIAKIEKELRKIREAQKTAQYIEKPPETESEPPYVSSLEKQLKAEKASQHLEKMQEQQSSAEQTAKRMNEIKERFIELETAKISLIDQHNKDKYEIPNMEYRAELLEEHAQNIEVLQNRIAQLQEARQNVRMFEFKQKKDIDEKIARATQELGKAQDYFRNRFNVDPSQAAEELQRLQEEIRTKKDELNTKQIKVQTIREKQTALELEYHTQKLLAETRPNHEQINSLLEQTHQPPKSVRDKILRERIEHQLNIISDASFQRVIEKLPTYQAHILSDIREQAKEHEQLLKFEREQAFLTQYYQTTDKKAREQLLKADDERRTQSYDRTR
ncbi:MAG: MobA/MobL family protein [Nitrososphaerota archaeon]|jgi:hypothetical protein|nr:MobA/MobL family protein [Nitrososphaerota archaeon]